MTETLRTATSSRHVTGRLLLADHGGVPPKVVIPADDSGTQRLGSLDERDVLIADGRDIAATFSLDREGFAFIRRPSAVINFEDDAEVQAAYYPEIVRIVSEALGASEVEIFDHTIRVTDPATSYRRPASHAHNDYTETSGPKRLTDMIGEERAREWLRDRVVQVNVWRPIVGPVKRMPLAVLDASSTEPSDLVATQIINERQKGRVGEIYSAAHRDGHRWFYFPDMTVDEAILIKGFDSAKDGRARFAPHSAFEDPTTPADAPPRRSIEVRTFARVPA